jgi:hypothetical protein
VAKEFGERPLGRWVNSQRARTGLRRAEQQWDDGGAGGAADGARLCLEPKETKLAKKPAAKKKPAPKKHKLGRVAPQIDYRR